MRGKIKPIGASVRVGSAIQPVNPVLHLEKQLFHELKVDGSEHVPVDTCVAEGVWREGKQCR